MLGLESRIMYLRDGAISHRMEHGTRRSLMLSCSHPPNIHRHTAEQKGNSLNEAPLESSNFDSRITPGRGAQCCKLTLLRGRTSSWVVAIDFPEWTWWPKQGRGKKSCGVTYLLPKK